MINSISKTANISSTQIAVFFESHWHSLTLSSKDLDTLSETGYLEVGDTSIIDDEFRDTIWLFNGGLDGEIVVIDQEGEIFWEGNFNDAEIYCTKRKRRKKAISIRA